MPRIAIGSRVVPVELLPPAITIAVASWMVYLSEEPRILDRCILESLRGVDEEIDEAHLVASYAEDYESYTGRPWALPPEARPVLDVGGLVVVLLPAVMHDAQAWELLEVAELEAASTLRSTGWAS